jgi:hypothetical protein
LHQPVPPSVKAGAKLERKLGIYPMIEPPPIIAIFIPVLYQF